MGALVRIVNTYVASGQVLDGNGEYQFTPITWSITDTTVGSARGGSDARNGCAVGISTGAQAAALQKMNRP